MLLMFACNFLNKIIGLIRYILLLLSTAKYSNLYNAFEIVFRFDFTNLENGISYKAVLEPFSKVADKAKRTTDWFLYTC